MCKLSLLSSYCYHNHYYYYCRYSLFLFITLYLYISPLLLYAHIIPHSRPSPQVSPPLSSSLPAGVVVGASRAGEGLYGCGQWRSEGIAAYNALKWSLERVNLDTGGLGSRIVSDSFVPGVKFGKSRKGGKEGRAGEGKEGGWEGGRR